MLLPEDFLRIFNFFSKPTGNVDVVHVRGRNLGSNLGDEVQDELDVIRLALLGVHIPERSRGTSQFSRIGLTSSSHIRWEPPRCNPHRGNFRMVLYSPDLHYLARFNVELQSSYN